MILRGWMHSLGLTAALTVTLQCAYGQQKPNINEKFPIRSGKELSPPIVSPVGECAKAVHVSGFIPHAIVRVFVNGTPAGTANPYFAEADIAVSPLKLGDVVTATQEVLGVRLVGKTVFATAKEEQLDHKSILYPQPTALGKCLHRQYTRSDGTRGIDFSGERVAGRTQALPVECLRRGMAVVHDFHFDGIAKRLHRREPLRRGSVECRRGGPARGLKPERLVAQHDDPADREVTEANEIQGSLHGH